MFGWKKVRERLEGIERKLDRLAGLVSADERLAKQNQDLFDRLMSIKWEEYVTGSPSAYERLGGGETLGGSKYSLPTADEANIGEVLSDEELGK